MYFSGLTPSNQALPFAPLPLVFITKNTNGLYAGGRNSLAISFIVDVRTADMSHRVRDIRDVIIQNIWGEVSCSVFLSAAFPFCLYGTNQLLSECSWNKMLSWTPLPDAMNTVFSGMPSVWYLALILSRVKWWRGLRTEDAKRWVRPYGSGCRQYQKWLSTTSFSSFVPVAARVKMPPSPC